MKNVWYFTQEHNETYSVWQFSRLDHKQWLMFPISDYMIIRWSTNILAFLKREMSQLIAPSPISYIKMMAKTYQICDIHSTEYTWPAFYLFTAFKQLYMVTIMSGYDLRVIMYLIIWTHHWLPDSHGNINPAFSGSIWSNRQNMTVQPPQTHPTTNIYDINGKNDTFDSMMIIRWCTNISSRSSKSE